VALGCGVLLAAGALRAVQEAPALGGAPVGIPVSVRDLVLPGGELEVRPVDDATPLIVRLDAVRPHGDRFRYDLVWYGLEPGRYDLGAFLRRKGDGQGPELPALPVEVRSQLAPGQVQPRRPAQGTLPALGGYRLLLAGAGALWGLGLLALLLARRRGRARAQGLDTRPPGSAARLRELVEAASAGELAGEGRAALELALIGWWKRRLGLEALEAGDALARLHEHPEAGALLRGLEDWLHRPERAGRPPVDVAALLEPYRGLDDEELAPGVPVPAAEPA
jgi:hypothetical protein